MRSAPYLAIWGFYLGKWNAFAVNIPRFVWLIVSGIVSQTLLSFMHKGDKKAPAAKDAARAAAAPGSNEAKAIAEAVRRRAAAKADKEKLASQQQEADRVVEASNSAKRVPLALLLSPPRPR